jgi:hypothetical protein
VSNVEVDFAAKTAKVTMAPGKTLSQGMCDQAFQGSKYAVSSVRSQ